MFPLYVIVPLIVVVFVNVIFSIAYRNTEKVDKGKALNYHRLSYRRKRRRSFYGIPVAALMLLVVYWFANLLSNELIILGIFFFVLVSLDIMYHYMKWRKGSGYARRLRYLS